MNAARLAQAYRREANEVEHRSAGSMVVLDEVAAWVEKLRDRADLLDELDAAVAA